MSPFFLFLFFWLDAIYYWKFNRVWKCIIFCFTLCCCVAKLTLDAFFFLEKFRCFDRIGKYTMRRCCMWRWLMALVEINKVSITNGSGCVHFTERWQWTEFQREKYDSDVS